MDYYGNMRLSFSDNIFKMLAILFTSLSMEYSKIRVQYNVKKNCNELVVSSNKTKKRPRWFFAIVPSCDGKSCHVICENTNVADIDINIGDIISMQHGDIIDVKSPTGNSWRCNITGFEWPVK